MPEKKELTDIQRYALMAAKNEADEARQNVLSIVRDIFAEHGVPAEDIVNWNFSNNFRYIEKQEPKIKDEKEKEN